MKFPGISLRAAGRWAGVVTLGALSLAGCGGGTQIDPFQPTRIIAFGDEYSVINTDASVGSVGAKYTVNSFTLDSSGNNTTTVDCNANASWIQSVAAAYHLAFTACPAGNTNPTGIDAAKAGAKVADVANQIANFQAGANGPFHSGDIVTVMVGQNDVLEVFDSYPSTPESALADELTARGKALAQQINQIALAGPAVVVMRIPDIGYTPYAHALGADKAKVLSDLTSAFNTGLQLNMINDGHLIGLVYGDSEVQNMVNFSVARSPNNAAFPFTNVSDPVCAAPAAATSTKRDDVPLLLSCTTSTLASGVDTTTYGNYLWAGNLMLGPAGQGRLGYLAATRAINNPF